MGTYQFLAGSVALKVDVWLQSRSPATALSQMEHYSFCCNTPLYMYEIFSRKCGGFIWNSMDMETEYKGREIKEASKQACKKESCTKKKNERGNRRLEKE